MPQSRRKSGLAALGPAEVDALVETHFPQLHADGKLIVIDELTSNGARVRMRGSDKIARPGGTVSGPAMFMLADVGVYIALLGARGEAVLDAVTASMSINFLSRPQPVDLIAEVRILRIGRRTATATVELFSDGSDELVAHATGLYALPQPVK